MSNNMIVLYINRLEDLKRLMKLFNKFSEGKEKKYWLTESNSSTHEFISAFTGTYVQDLEQRIKKEESQKKEYF